MNEKNDSTKRRLFDVTIPVKLAELKQEMRDFKEDMHRKLDNGITGALTKIMEKVMTLQCNVHIEKINNLQSTIDKDIAHCNRKINGLYWAFTIVFLVVILSLAGHYFIQKSMQKKVSMAQGAEGYRMSQMIYRDLHKKL